MALSRAARLVVTDTSLIEVMSDAVSKIDNGKGTIILETLSPPTEEMIAQWNQKLVVSSDEGEWEAQRQATLRYEAKLRRKAGRPAWRR